MGIEIGFWGLFQRSSIRHRRWSTPRLPTRYAYGPPPPVYTHRHDRERHHDYGTVVIDTVTRWPARPALLRSGFAQFCAHDVNVTGNPAP
jgi:hypothetical protein